MLRNAFGVGEQALHLEVFSLLYPEGVEYRSPGLAPCAYPGRTGGTPENPYLTDIGLKPAGMAGEGSPIYRAFFHSAAGLSRRPGLLGTEERPHP